MAGAILVAETSAVSMNTLDFDYIVEKIRLEFSETDSSTMTAIYEPMDEGAMTFISLIEQDAEGFKTFLRAVSEAYDRENQDSPRACVWQELLLVLRSDARCDR